MCAAYMNQLVNVSLLMVMRGWFGGMGKGGGSAGLDRIAGWWGGYLGICSGFRF